MSATGNRRRLAVFDCDGTLVDGQAMVCDSMEHAFSMAGLATPDRNEVRRMVGLSLPVAVRYLAPDADEHTARNIVEHYKSGFRERRLDGSLEEPLYDGIRELLTKLHGDGWLLAVATGKSDRGLKGCLEMHGLFDLFVSLQTADRHPSKPDPAMLEAAIFEAGVQASEAVMIGDTSFDMLMAQQAGVRAVGVAWGYHEPQELLDTGAAVVADRVEQLEELL